MADQFPSNDSGPNPAVPQESESANPLPYEAPRDQLARNPQPNILLNTVVFAGSFALAGGIMLFVNMYVAMGLGGSSERHPHLHQIMAAMFGLIGVATVIGSIRAANRSGVRTAGVWMGSGALMGAGVSMLAGGICFGSL